MLLLYQIHPTITLNLISSFPCEHIPGTGTSYLKADYSIDCKSSEYIKFAIVSAIYLVLYVLGMMVYVLAMLRHNHISGKLHTPSHNAYIKYKFFFMGYRKETYFWESVIMLRKMGIVAFSVLASPMLQLVFANVILFIALVINMDYRPFASYFVSRLESFSLVTLLVTVTLGFLFINSDNNTGANMLWISVLVILVNSAMMSMLVFNSIKYLRSFIDKFVPKSWRNKNNEDGVAMTKNPKSLSTTVDKTTEMGGI